MEAGMPCPEGDIHDYKLVGDAFICSKCSRVAPFKPVMTHAEALEKYHTLLEMCHNLIDGTMSYNDFEIWLENQ